MKVYIFCKHTSWGYGRIVQELELSKSQVISVISETSEKRH